MKQPQTTKHPVKAKLAATLSLLYLCVVHLHNTHNVMILLAQTNIHEA